MRILMPIDKLLEQAKRTMEAIDKLDLEDFEEFKKTTASAIRYRKTSFWGSIRNRWYKPTEEEVFTEAKENFYSKYSAQRKNLSAFINAAKDLSDLDDHVDLSFKDLKTFGYFRNPPYFTK